MASLDASGGVNCYEFVSLVSLRQKASIWSLTLQSASDTLTIPACPAAGQCVSLTTGVTATAATRDEGTTIVTITGGVRGTKCVIAALHRVGMLNNTNIDEDPT
jgi:hypothetical protein